jgi:uncharacterized protein YkwD
MIKPIMLYFSVFLFLLTISPSTSRSAILSDSLNSTESDLVDEVNKFRISSGLPPYIMNPILMSIAKSQAEYEQSIGSQTDISSDGLRPFQRALEAGYPVAGNVTTNVGLLSELLYGGVSVTAKDAVQWWYNDAGHEPYLMSTLYRDIGAGAAQSNNTYYYVIVVALSTGGTPAPITPPSPRYTAVQKIIVSTPNEDGSIYHIVQHGDTPLGIALAYGVSLSSLNKLNNLTEKSLIYVGGKLLIRIANTPTPTQSTATPTQFPTFTLWPTSKSTTTPTLEIITPTEEPKPLIISSSSYDIVIIIILAALLIAGIFVVLGNKHH